MKKQDEHRLGHGGNKKERYERCRPVDLPGGGGAGKPITEPPSLNLAEVLLVRPFRGEVTMIADPGADQAPGHTCARGETVYKDAGRLSWRNR